MPNDLDERIVHALAEDARRSYADIGQEVGLSAPAVKRRVDRLRATGAITGFTVRVDPAALGWETEGFVEIHCRRNTSPETIQRGLERYQEVVAASTVTGEADARALHSGRAAGRPGRAGRPDRRADVCYDVEFPENVRAHALAGTDLLLVPTAQMHPFQFVAEAVIPVRAFENQMYVAYVNRVGQEGEFDFVGLSTLAGPDGVARARAGRGEELVLADADPAFLAASREANPYLQDRRPGLYGSLV